MKDKKLELEVKKLIEAGYTERDIWMAARKMAAKQSLVKFKKQFNVC